MPYKQVFYAAILTAALAFDFTSSCMGGTIKGQVTDGHGNKISELDNVKVDDLHYWLRQVDPDTGAPVATLADRKRLNVNDDGTFEVSIEGYNEEYGTQVVFRVEAVGSEYNPIYMRNLRADRNHEVYLGLSRALAKPRRRVPRKWLVYDATHGKFTLTGANGTAYYKGDDYRRRLASLAYSRSGKRFYYYRESERVGGRRGEGAGPSQGRLWAFGRKGGKERRRCHCNFRSTLAVWYKEPKRDEWMFFGYAAIRFSGKMGELNDGGDAGS